VILPLLGVIEKPTTPPATIEADFKASQKAKAGTPGGPSPEAIPAE
jgi:ubiquinol-cytochrome c reductase cytochrome b subunit